MFMKSNLPAASVPVVPPGAPTVPGGTPSAPAPRPARPSQSNVGIIQPQFSAARPQAVYPVPYGPPKADEILKVLTRLHDYLAANSPARFVHRTSGEEIPLEALPHPNAVLERGVFNLVGYEWGVVYAGMLLVAERSGVGAFRDYAAQRLAFIARVAVAARPPGYTPGGRSGGSGLFRGLNFPRTLDDCGSMAAAMAKAARLGLRGELQPVIETAATWVHTKQERLADGTLSRSRPLPYSLWLDDLYMSVPLLAQMGKLTGERKYFDDAVRQVTQFAARMFNPAKGLFMHGWVEGMEVHPEFHWGRANGWAAVAMAELLEVLPEDHPGRAEVLGIFKAHLRGVAARQARDGRWHQLLDRPDSYLETSCTAMFCFAAARGVNRGWIDPLAHAPLAILAWNAVTTQVNALGQVENVCVGTGMGFDPAFYYARPVSPVAPHGPGPVLLAGAEMLTLAQSGRALINDEAVMFGRPTGM
jgi:rhamnogalacturonyl hydrolase YesR